MGNINKNLVIIRIDGGICSQLEFCALGKYFEDKGYQVKYDVSWYEDSGMDLNGVFVRNFDMKKAFPTINLEIATKEEINYYKKYYLKKNTQILLNCTAPVYICDYPEERSCLMYKYKNYFKQKFSFKDANAEQQLLLQEILTNNSCAIHVRRGDIVTSKCYGEPASKEYFLKAINTINAIHDNVVFYFFSDEMDWVKENIIPSLCKDIKYQICDNNGSDKGYLDLYIISKCKYIISSNGSLGVFGKILSDDSTELWMCKPRTITCEMLENVYIINCPETIADKNIDKLLTVNQNKKNDFSNTFYDKYKKYKTYFSITVSVFVAFLLFFVFFVGKILF